MPNYAYEKKVENCMFVWGTVYSTLNTMEQNKSGKKEMATERHISLTVTKTAAIF